MATLYGTNATKRDNSNPSSAIDVGDQGGRVRLSYDEYVAAGALTSGDVIRLGKVPANARIVNVITAFPDLGTTGSFKLGWEANGVDVADDDGFLAAVDVNTAADTVSMADQSNMPGQFKKFGAETQISLTLAANTTAAGTIKCGVLYTLD